MTDHNHAVPDINPTSYEWSVRAFSTVKKLLGVNIKLHDHADKIKNGHIFLFNHFSRFETFIPQYLIYQEEKAYCRSVASSEFFVDGTRFTSYLYSVGALPNNLPTLLPQLALDILKGYKIIIFPEGGMVKDKKILGEDGDYSIFSPTAKARRKHHTGAARLALMLDVFKQAVLNCKSTEKKQRWASDLGFSSVDALIAQCQTPTRIVPSNITFYPIRLGENLLKSSVERFAGTLPAQFSEELLIEGNLLLKDTDMDIRMGSAIEPSQYYTWYDKILFNKTTRHLDSLDDLYEVGRISGGIIPRLTARRLLSLTNTVRDEIMGQMYQLVSVNLSHIASVLLLHIIDEGHCEIKFLDFCRQLYAAAHHMSEREDLHLHRSLFNAEIYRNLYLARSTKIAQFIEAAEQANLLALEGETLYLRDKLREDNDFQTIRQENPICVYANEVEALPHLKEIIIDSHNSTQSYQPDQWAELLIAQEYRAYASAKIAYQKPEFDEINNQQTATKDATPFYLAAPQANVGHKPPLGVLLVHGFLASPAEMRPLGEMLNKRGYPVFGVRLEGHGTSPCDLRERHRLEWISDVQRGYDIIAAHCERVMIIGFSTGAMLTLNVAADNPDKLAGVISAAAPLKFANPNLKFVPLVHRANQVAEWLSLQEGVLPYILNESEHPEINYRHIPVRALYELKKLVDETEKKLSTISAPALILQGDNESVVNPKSAGLLAKKMTSTAAEVIMVRSDRHGIITEDIDQTCAHIMSYVEKIQGQVSQNLLG